MATTREIQDPANRAEYTSEGDPSIKAALKTLCLAEQDLEALRPHIASSTNSAHFDASGLPTAECVSAMSQLEGIELSVGSAAHHLRGALWNSEAAKQRALSLAMLLEDQAKEAGEWLAKLRA